MTLIISMELKKDNNYLVFQQARSLWKSAVAITSSAIGGERLGGGYATRKARNL